MDAGLLQTTLFTLGGCALGGVVGWTVQTILANRKMGHMASNFQGRLDEAVAQRNDVDAQFRRAISELEQVELQGVKQRAKYDDVKKKAKLLARNVRLLQTERENTKLKLGSLQTALTTLKQQTSNLQNEFNKTREFYKRELLKSLNRRKELEKDIVDARADQESFAKAVESSSLEHGSKEDMVIAAQLRLGQLEVLERNINKLEAENEELRQDAIRLKRELASIERDQTELEQLRLNNKQLVQCVEALESSRKAHEEDANRYRDKADESEKLSDTLRLKLDDLQKNFEDIEKQQSEAIEDVRKAAVVPMVRKHG